MRRSIYRFGSDVVDGDGTMKDLLGGKGAGLAEMTLLSVPVPPGFTITVDVRRYFFSHGVLPASLEAEIDAAILSLESASGKRFGDDLDPLLVSVRSGAPISMPGMMDTILNVGLNDNNVRGLAASGSERFAYDSYRRLIQMFGSVVLDVPKAAFDQALESILAAERNVSGELSSSALQLAVEAFKFAVERHTGQPFPQCPKLQLKMTVRAVFES